MEVWKEIFKNIIPSDKYDASIINSNVDGLVEETEVECEI